MGQSCYQTARAKAREPHQGVQGRFVGGSTSRVSKGGFNVNACTDHGGKGHVICEGLCSVSTWRFFLARCCLGQVPGGAPFSQRSEQATACTNRMQIRN